MKIDTEGTYMLKYSAEDSCGNVTTVDREVTVSAPAVYGVYWDGGPDSRWVRTDDAEDFAAPQPAVANGMGSSPFDSIMPWSGMQVVEDTEAGTLVSIPKYWYKIETASVEPKDIKIQISNQPLDGFSVSPAHRDRNDGVGERDVVYVGRYVSANDYKSKTNVSPLVNKTRGEFRSGITALGDDIWQFDFSMYWTIALLYLVEFANWNSQAKIGLGCGTTYPNVPNTGSTDAMQYHTGTDAPTSDEYGNIQYRYIEGLWSGLYFWCDGIVIDNISQATRLIYEYTNPSDYADQRESVISKSSVVGTIPRYTGVPLQWGMNNSQYPKLYPIKEAQRTVSYQQYSCDSISIPSIVDQYMLRLGALYQSLSPGMFSWQMGETRTQAGATFGGRLQKLPSA